MHKILHQNTMSVHEVVVRPGRQRTEFSEDYMDKLEDSILRHGLFQPIVVDRGHVLVIGECRLRVFQKLAKHSPEYVQIPYVYVDEASEEELKILELEENLRRLDLNWMDKAKAFRTIHQTLLKLDEETSLEYTGGQLGCSGSQVGHQIQVADALDTKDDKELLACTSTGGAIALLNRRLKRIVKNEIVKFGTTEQVEDDMVLDLDLPDAATIDDSYVTNELLDDMTLNLEDLSLDVDSGDPTSAIPDVARIIHGSFLDDDHLPTLRQGEPFNFIHCDFPYGVGMHKSAQTKTEVRAVQYEDTDEIYWELLARLVDIQDEILSVSCHMMFWFPMSKYEATRDYLQINDWKVNAYPLVWIKEDKVGIMPDANRYPRRIYETAFLCSRGDRYIRKATVNGICSPSEKRSAEHVSLKPKSVFLEFLRIFIDEDSVVFDPTCGSGTALGVSIQLGATGAVGMDISLTAVEMAETECLAGVMNRVPIRE